MPGLPGTESIHPVRFPPMSRTHIAIGIASLAAILSFLMIIFTSGRSGVKEQYVVVNIPDQEFRSAFMGIERLEEKEGSSRVGLGIGGIFSYFNEPRSECEAHLREFLSLAEQYDIPIVVQLDGEQWWKVRPDLWNWWDPEQPGYNPRNRHNVEWTGWGPEHAVKIAWRNWGRQIRVLPPPNLMSTRYREACHDEMSYFIPLILEWWYRLPDNRKDLLIGIKLGWESSIGVNSFYYPNGNDLLNRPVTEDPMVELKADAVPDRGVVTIGYASVTTARLASGGELQEAHLAEVVRRHLEDLCALAAGLGMPREKLFTHVGGWKDEELLYESALNRYSCPGWSFYRYALDARKDKGVQKALTKNDAAYWAAVEWMLTTESTPDDWRNAIQRTLSIPKCRYICLYNWDGIRINQGARDAIQEVMRSDHNAETPVTTGTPHN